MFNEIVKTIKWGEHTLELRTGKIARQADGAVMVKMGDSIVLCTAVSAKDVKEGAGFFPLTVHYREMAFAAGKIPGGFFKTEGKASNKEALVSRLIDRPIRPLFHESFFNETQIVCTVLSYDPACSTDILAIIGASAALAISGVPYLSTVAASRVGLIDDKFVLNPSFEKLKSSKLNLVLAGTDSSVMMVEAQAHILSEEQMIEAVKFGHEKFQPVINAINELAAEAGKPKWETRELYPVSLKDQIHAMKEEEIREAFAIKIKQEKALALHHITTSVFDYYGSREEGEQFAANQLASAIAEVKSDILRKDLLENNIRMDGRKFTDIRKIECEVSLLPKAHGSALFTRGETQSLVVTTLGTSQDEQRIDSLEGEYKEPFMLNYIFPPYSVGEATPMRAPSRREIGHGNLAREALYPVLPGKECPYTIRIVSEITESNGSSSMATVCGASMALMDAGVPIKAPVAGIAMGLIKEDNNIVILSDISGEEDYLGDMDFKVAGTKEGITALQMDIKVTGITFAIMEKALSQAREGRFHILDKMQQAITHSNMEVSKYAPAIKSFKIDKDKIREIIGPGGKVIREICETTGAKIDISDDGTVSVSAIGSEKLEAAIKRIKSIAVDPEIGEIFEGTVVKVLEAGAFINYSGNRDGFIHISELSHEKVESVAKILTMGEVVKIKVIGFDNKGKAKLTMKNLENNKTTEKLPAPPNSYNKDQNKPYKQPEPRKKLPAEKEENETVSERKYFS